ncbi:phage tail protein [Mesorhizobium sp.]|uniref:phage tail protein n=1 Tax=Mesorhizobium sp. TaxID=1871066 RepID=UPI0012271823|nr:phage tail protein [Mesorhizobium sp.]TIS37497.1 MAG: phage tail protein [Mesorhizobium sp.]
MASELIVGVKHLRDGIEAQAVLGADMSVIGIIGTAPDADAGVFPLDTAVLMYTNDKALLTALGTTGTLVDAVKGISAQLGGGVGAARCVLVRVTDNASAQVVIGSILGNEANGTGVYAFLDAPEDLGVTPRLLIAPGYTSQQVTGVKFGAITAPGAGGTNGTFALAFVGGTGTGAEGTFTVAGGALTAVTITAPGNYTVAPTLSFAASANLVGATAALTLETFANGVCAIMPAICERLKAMFLPEGPTNTRAAAVDWLETIPRSQRVLHPLRQDAKILDSLGDVVTKPLSPYVIGLYVRRDAEHDGRPGHSIANQQIYGIVGVSPTIPFSITDPAVVGQDDLAISLGIVFRGDTGVDGALTDGGFTFWGTDTLSEQSEWLFANVCRMRDYIELMQVRAVRTYLGKFNLTAQTVQAIINTLDTQLRNFKADGDILDYRIEFDPDANSPEELRLGNIDLTFRAEEPPVLRKILIRSRRYAEALDGLVRSISIQLGNQGVA